MAETISQVKIRGRFMNIENGGLTPEEITSVIAQLEKKIAELEERTNIVDTSKLVSIVAAEIAIELYKLKKS